VSSRRNLNSRNQNEISREDTKAKTEFHNKVTKAAKIRDINSSLWPLRPCCENRYVATWQNPRINELNLPVVLQRRTTTAGRVNNDVECKCR
jgi:hypothetical protein